MDTSYWNRNRGTSPTARRSIAVYQAEMAGRSQASDIPARAERRRRAVARYAATSVRVLPHHGDVTVADLSAVMCDRLIEEFGC